MLSDSRLTKLQGIVYGAKPNTMRSVKGRRAFAHHLASELGMIGERVTSFVEEMAGLNFFNAEDRQLFIELAQLGL